MKTGIYGGVFDPVHLGHVTLANYVLESGIVDRLIILPTSLPPHKKLPFVTIEHRFNMILLAFGQENPFIIFSKYESENKVSCTYNSIEHFKKKYPQDDLFLIIGIDSMLQLKNWKNYKTIVDNVNFIVSPRQNSNIDKLKTYFSRSFVEKKVLILNEFKSVSISSTDLKKMIITDRKNISTYLSENIIDYIVENRLYGINYENLEFRM